MKELLNAFTLAITSAPVVLGLFSFLRKEKDDRRNYSLGLASAEGIQQLIKNGQYAEAEQELSVQSLNDLSQVIDHLALSLQEEVFLTWKEVRHSDYAKLSLGVFYLHKAWIARSHQLANRISSKNADRFFDYLEQSYTAFEEISEDAQCLTEAASRRIRLYMSFDEMELAGQVFHQLSEEHPDFVWPYIHYAELIQPKWGGTVEEVLQLYENLPDNFLIRSIMELKLIFDAMVMEDHYFKKYNRSLKDFAKQKLLEIDQQLAEQELTSIHRYILYNYMEVVAESLRKSSLKKNYRTLSGNYYTLYPYGLLK